MTGVFIICGKFGHWPTKEKMAVQRWNHQETLEPPEVERGRKDPPLELGEGSRPCHTLSLDFWPQNWEPIHLFVVFCYSSPRAVSHTEVVPVLCRNLGQELQAVAWQHLIWHMFMSGQSQVVSPREITSGIPNANGWWQRHTAGALEGMLLVKRKPSSVCQNQIGNAKIWWKEKDGVGWQEK